ncbi:helix-turn-helix transcriptional regulator [Schaalia sp. ZJ1691]|uniref:helix-turn-helix domain-containing protein n=1 Tax=Schaalia sp. ZJ1691 TaxID=2709404 RepID=UPI0013E9F3A4|nr:helix-turn-helix transcriptional regulator [Schaalia sp. ZJ1691]
MSTITALRTVDERTTADIVAENIRAEAARAGFSQVALGRALGMSQNQITTRWRGVHRWQLDELDAVADLLGISVVDLVSEVQIRRTPSGGSHRAGSPRGIELRPRQDSNLQPRD